MRMKTKLLRVALIVAVASLPVLIFSCRPHSTDEEVAHGLVILPSGDHAKLEANWDKVAAILHEKSDIPGVDRRKLFRIRKYIPGQPPVNDPADGMLEDSSLVEEINDSDAKALREHFKGHAIQIGLAAQLDFQTVPPEATPSEEHAPSLKSEKGGKTVKMPQAHYQANIVESQKMVDEVNAALNNSNNQDPSKH